MLQGVQVCAVRGAGAHASSPARMLGKMTFWWAAFQLSTGQSDYLDCRPGGRVNIARTILQ